MHLSAVVASSQLMDRSMWYHVRSAALMPCLGSDFLQFTCPKHLLMFAASDYSRAREGQEENLLFFQLTFEK